jgi:hypothetical protein
MPTLRPDLKADLPVVEALASFVRDWITANPTRALALRGVQDLSKALEASVKDIRASSFNADPIILEEAPARAFVYLSRLYIKIGPASPITKRIGFFVETVLKESPTAEVSSEECQATLFLTPPATVILTPPRSLVN